MKIQNVVGKAGEAHVAVDPGVCGFTCMIHAYKAGKTLVKFEIQSDCDQIKKLAGGLGEIGLKDLFLPMSKSPIFLRAEKSQCHLACTIPCSLVKAAEVALGLALPKRVMIKFDI
jgi:hypothetical protein